MRASVIDQTHPSTSIPSPSASISQQPFISGNSIRVTRSSISNDWIDKNRIGSGGRIILFSSDNDFQNTWRRSQEDRILGFDDITSLPDVLTRFRDIEKYLQINIKMEKLKSLHGTVKIIYDIPISQDPMTAFPGSPFQARYVIKDIRHNAHQYGISRHLTSQTSVISPAGRRVKHDDR